MVHCRMHPRMQSTAYRPRVMAAGRRLGFSLIVAADKNRGIGYKGHIVWPELATDLGFMWRIIDETKDKNKQNAVIMGKDTWASNPESMHPIKGCFNVVLTRTLTKKDIPAAHLVSPSLEGAMQELDALSDKIEYVYILGGANVYEKSMLSPRCDGIYYTNLFAEFPSDRFMPPINMSRFAIVPKCDEVPQGIIEENGIKYEFVVYRKIEAIQEN